MASRGAEGFAIAKAAGAMAGFGNIWSSRQISLHTKAKIIKRVFSTACESCTLNKQDKDIVAEI